jgi:glycerol-3-phosphate cytidylyltransferase-like family protein
MKTGSLFDKIKDLDELAGIVQCIKKEGKPIVHCHGVFNLLHPGQIQHFDAAGKEGDVLVVMVTEDKCVGKGPFPYVGVMSISSFLKHHGLKTDVLIGSFEKDILKGIEQISPDGIGFSVMSSDHKWMVELAAQIKTRFDIPIVVGGVHASSSPEVIIGDKNIDYVVIGEGENVFLQLIDNIYRYKSERQMSFFDSI